MNDYKLTEMQHLETSAKAVELLADVFHDDYQELFEHIACGYGKTFLHFLAHMASYRLSGQDMTAEQHETNKIGCLTLCQKLEEELRPWLKPHHDELVNELEQPTKRDD
jgi:hypothetical protein